MTIRLEPAMTLPKAFDTRPVHCFSSLTSDRTTFVTTRPFSDWMRAAEQVCTTLVGVGFRFVVFTHSYLYGGMQPLVTMARFAPAAAPLRMATQVLLLPLMSAAVKRVG